jgi:hypothetical protein
MTAAVCASALGRSCSRSWAAKNVAAVTSPLPVNVRASCGVETSDGDHLDGARPRIAADHAGDQHDVGSKTAGRIRSVNHVFHRRYRQAGQTGQFELIRGNDLRCRDHLLPHEFGNSGQHVATDVRIT